MSGRSGLSDLDVAVLDTLFELGARSDRPHVKSARALLELQRRTGIAPRYGYEVMCDLAAPWLVNLQVLDPHGNFGSREFGPANSRYTEVRLSGIGMLAVDAERGGPRAPIGLINGDIHLDGVRPPFEPLRVIDALTQAADRPDVTDDELIELLGPPTFPTGCEVDGDLDRLAAGDPCRLTLRARMAHERAHDRDVIVVQALPPMASCGEIAATIKTRVERQHWHRDHPGLAAEVVLPIADVNDQSTMRRTRLVVSLEPEADPRGVEAQLYDIWGIAVTIQAHLPAPVPRLLREWIEDCDDEPLAGLHRLRSLVT